MTPQPKRRLGRGLAALIGDDASEESMVQDIKSLRHVPVEFLRASPNNPRKAFDEEELADLSRSIGEKGLLQPLVVRPLPDGQTYEIVAGERRWRAAQRAGLHDLPVLIRELSDGEALEIALVENVQRSDLSALEEARGYGQLIDEFTYTQQQLADAVGKSRSHIANTLRLMSLPKKVQDRLESGELTAGHARALIAAPSPEQLAEQIVAQGLTVRQAEKLSRDTQDKSAAGKSPKAEPTKNADVVALEKALGEALGLKVVIVDKGGDKGGQVSIAYTTLEQLDDICQRLARRQLPAAID